VTASLTFGSLALSDQTAEAKQTVSAAVDQARQTGQAAWHEAKSKISDLQSLETYVREKPTQAVLVALGVGFIMGFTSAEIEKVDKPLSFAPRFFPARTVYVLSAKKTTPSLSRTLTPQVLAKQRRQIRNPGVLCLTRILRYVTHVTHGTL